MDQITSGSSNPERIFKFWETKQGTILTGIGAAAILGLLYAVGPALLAIVKNLFLTLNFALACSIVAIPLAFLYVLVTNPRFQLAFTLAADSLARTIMRKTIDRDPIAAGRHALDRM